MLEYIKGTVFNTPVKTIVNTVNCMGVMGAGIALEFKMRYPEMYEDYVIKCEKKQLTVGRPIIYEYSNDRWIMNFPTKNHWKYPSKIEWIEQGLKYFAEYYKKRNIESIAFPKLGTSNGGLEWEIVKPLMEKYLINLDIPVYICLDENIEAEGVEKEMVNMLNACTKENLVCNVKLTKKQADIVINNFPYKRFWHISNLEGIGVGAYEKVFKYFYNKSTFKKNRICF